MNETYEDIGSAVILTALIAYFGLTDPKALALIFTVLLLLVNRLRVRYFTQKP